MPHYLQILKAKGYRYRRIMFPHDQDRRNAMGYTVLNEANKHTRELGLPMIEVGRMMARDSQVYMALSFLGSNMCFIDESNCREGLEEYNHTNRTTYSASKKATDIADSFCYMAVASKTNQDDLNLDTQSLPRKYTRCLNMSFSVPRYRF